MYYELDEDDGYLEDEYDCDYHDNENYYDDENPWLEGEFVEEDDLNELI